jgi:hypothetical protein
MTIYNNIPKPVVTSSSDSTVQYFNTFYQRPISLNDADIVAVTGFFENAGFSADTANSVALIILSQSKLSNLNAFELLDTLKKLNGLELSSKVAQILNHNRFKTSNLGTISIPTPADEIERNILA